MKMLKKVCLTVLFMLLVVLTPVSEMAGIQTTAVVQAAAKPKLSKTKVTVTRGDKITLKLKHAKKGKIKWKTADKKIAVIKADGASVTVTARKAGTVKIQATYKKKTYTCKVTVKNPAPSLSEKKKTIEADETFTLTLEHGGSDAKWKTSDSKVAGLKKIGKTKYQIIGKKAGTAKITVTYRKKKYTCTVTVKEKPVQEQQPVVDTVDLNIKNAVVNAGTPITVVLEGVPTNANVEWECSYDNGEYTAIDLQPKGNACVVTGYVADSYEPYYVTADYNEKEYRASIWVNPIIPEITVNSVELSMDESTKVDLGEYASYVTDWFLYDEEVIRMDQDGVITAREPGKTNAGVVVGGRLCIFDVIVTDIYLNKTDITLDSGNSFTFELKGVPANADVEWECAYDNGEWIAVDWEIQGNTCKVTGYEKGEYYFYAVYNEKEYHFKVNVNAILPKLTLEDVTLKIGEEIPAYDGEYASYMTAYYVDGEYLSDNGNGIIRAEAEGTERVCLLIGGVYCSYKVTVIE